MGRGPFAALSANRLSIPQGFRCGTPDDLRPALSAALRSQMPTRSWYVGLAKSVNE